MTHSLSVHIEEKMDYLWVTLPQSMNMDNYRQIEEQIIARLQGSNFKVVIDMSETSYLYSSGMGLLIRVRNHVIKDGGHLWLVNISDKCTENITSLNLDKILPMFSTDLEFELSQDTIWEDKLSKDPVKFLCVHQIEDGLCRINLTGRMVTTNDISSFNLSIYSDTATNYVFDLTGLEMIDSNGASSLLDFFLHLKENDVRCTTYGANSMILELMHLLGIDEYVKNYESEGQALKALDTDDVQQ